MLQNDQAKKKLLRSKVDFFAFLLGISVQGHFRDIKRQEGVGVRERGGLQSICNTNIHYMLDTIFLGISGHYYNGYKRKYRYFYIFWEHCQKVSQDYTRA
jgi:hypothetical protein